MLQIERGYEKIWTSIQKAAPAAAAEISNGEKKREERSLKSTEYRKLRMNNE